VAQRGGRQRTFGSGGNAKGVDEPAFVEWDFAGKRTGEKQLHKAARPGRQKQEEIVGDKEDYDDGSGLAWLRKRREERERRQRQAAADASAAEEAAVEEATACDEVKSVGVDPNVPKMIVTSPSTHADLPAESTWTGDEHQLTPVPPLSGSTTGSSTDEEDNSDGRHIVF
jgi:hypothetical protein